VTRYLLDANVFMAASRLHYGLDFCPAFWEWLVEANNTQRVFSIERVATEVQAGEDALAKWASERGNGFFLEPDAALQSALGTVANWATSQKYEPAAISTFFQVADYYLVAHALAHKHVVITHEVAANSTKRIKIPNACIGVGVQHMTPFEMLRREKARFVMEMRP
jgi:hypothetical protein